MEAAGRRSQKVIECLSVGSDTSEWERKTVKWELPTCVYIYLSWAAIWRFTVEGPSLHSLCFHSMEEWKWNKRNENGIFLWKDLFAWITSWLWIRNDTQPSDDDVYFGYGRVVFLLWSHLKPHSSGFCSSLIHSLRKKYFIQMFSQVMHKWLNWSDWEQNNVVLHKTWYLYLEISASAFPHFNAQHVSRSLQQVSGYLNVAEPTERLFRPHPVRDTTRMINGFVPFRRSAIS